MKMMRVRFKGEGHGASFSDGVVYDVLDVCLPFPKVPFIKVEDELHDVAWWPFSLFEFVEGHDELLSLSETLPVIGRKRAYLA